MTNDKFPVRLYTDQTVYVLSHSELPPVYRDDQRPDPVEVAYWRFDALRAGTAKECRVDETTKAPMSERDAFKAVTSDLVAAVRELLDFAAGVAVGSDVPQFFRNEAVNAGRLRAVLGKEQP